MLIEKALNFLLTFLMLDYFIECYLLYNKTHVINKIINKTFNMRLY